MADKVAEQKETITEKEVEKSPEVVDEDSKASENGDASDHKENGDKVEEDDDENGDSTDATEVVCPIKRKSAGGDAPEGTPAEGASPEKKAKLDEKTAEPEANGEEAKAAA